VVLRVEVRADGSTAGLKVLRSSGHRSLDQAATRTVRGWRFDPALRGGRPVAAQVVVPVVFSLDDLG